MSDPPPTPPGSPVGRGEILSALLASFEKTGSLIVLTGAAGVGKSHLASALLEAWEGSGRPALFVQLSGARAFSDLILEVGARVSPQRMPASAIDKQLQVLVEAFADMGDALLVLDNAERIAPDVARLVVPLRSRCDHLRILVTSRHPLGTELEERIPIEPLPVEDGVALFRALAAGQATWSQQDLDATRELVTQLDGLPLAITLAAGRTGVLSPTDLAARVGERLSLLRSEERRGRTASLEDALDLSWELLSGEEQRALACVSVFRGGFTLEDAEAVVVPPDLPALDLLGALREKSLLHTRRGAAGEGRLALLRSVRDYALARLSELSESAEVWARYQERILESAEALSPVLNQEDAPTAFEQLTERRDDLIAVCQRLHREDPVTAARAALAADPVMARGPLDVRRALLENALAEGLPPELSSQLRAMVGETHRLGGNPQRAEVLLREAIQIASEASLEAIAARTRLRLGLALRAAGRADDADAEFQAALRTSQELGVHELEALARNNLANLARERGELTQALEHAEEAVRLARLCASLRLEAMAEQNTGTIRMRQQQYAEADRHYHRALALYERLSEGGFVASVATNLGNQMMELQEYERAEELLNRALAAASAVGNARDVVLIHLNLALLKLLLEAWGEARANLEAARELLSRRELKWPSGLYQLNLGLLHTSTGDRAAAARAYQRSCEIFTEASSPQAAGVAATRLAPELAWLEKTEEAHQTLAEAASALGERGDPLHRLALSIARKHVEMLTLARAGQLERAQLRELRRLFLETSRSRVEGAPAQDQSGDVRLGLRFAISDADALEETLPRGLSRRGLLAAAAVFSVASAAGLASWLRTDSADTAGAAAGGAPPPDGDPDAPADLPPADGPPTRSTPLREVSIGGQAVPVYGTPHALVVGINDYPTRPLSYARQDAEAVAALLTERYGFAVTALYDAQATLLAVNQAIDSLKGALEPGDSLLIFWAGHGVVEEGRSGRVGYLVPYDGSFDPGAFNAKNLSMRHLSSLMTDLFVASHQLLIIDACYGGLATRGAPEEAPVDPEALRTLMGRAAVQIITAGAGDQEVLDVGEDGHSLFTARLLTALREADRYLTAGELFGRLEGEVAVAAQAMGHRQKPEYTRLEGDGSFVFLPLPD